ncbi:MAG: hypothetical protein ACREAZ_04830 [Nitrososphaera sp.]
MSDKTALYYAAAAATAIAGTLNLMLDTIQDGGGYLGTFNVVVDAGSS